MKTILLSLVVVSGLLMANVTENQEYCTKINAVLPSIVKVGLDVFTERDGNVSKCEDHSEEEWQNMVSTSEKFALFMSIYSSTKDTNSNNKSDTCSYERYLKQIENKEYSNEEMKTFLEEVRKECQQDGLVQESKK